MSQHFGGNIVFKLTRESTLKKMYNGFGHKYIINNIYNMCQAFIQNY